jgi:hypothetical protein
VVHLAGDNLPRVHLNTAEEEEGGEMGFDSCSGKMSSTPDNKDMDPEPKLRYNNEILKYWKIQTYTANSPDIRRIPKAL